MGKIRNVKFSARRAFFTSMLRIQPKLLPLFRWVFGFSVVFFTLALISLWIIRFPEPHEVTLSDTAPPPPSVPYDFLLEPPFRDLREPAARPTPASPSASSLNLTP